MTLSSIDFFFFIHLFVGFTCVLVSIILFFQKIKSYYLNTYIVFVLFLIGVRIIINQLTFSEEIGFSPLLKPPLNLLFVYTFSLFYLYVRSLVLGYERLTWSDVLYFLPIALLIVVNYILLNYFPEAIFQRHLLNLIVIFGLELFFILKVFLLLKSSIWNKKEIKHYSNRKLLKKWLVFCVSIFLLVTLKFNLTIDFENLAFNDLRDSKFALFNSLIMLTIISVILSSPKLFFGDERMKSTIIEQISSNKEINYYKLWLKKPKTLSNVQDQVLNARIGSRMGIITGKISANDFDQHLFRNPELTISEFAKNLGFPKSHLILLFKYYSKTSFVEFRTMVRIDIAIAEIDKGYLNMNTLESLASSIGFASYNPFFTAFKKYIGLSPKKYQVKQAKVLNASIANSISEG